ncbi:oxidoreductase-like domain-containing protein [Leeia oryzae]|uniref:oxidoreductase-like domain-containing protein n=1 Tax=Leeia oryzae TaxID=356662 RepID=UPI0003643146|nr:oxidoreductase-like domain-containing protein [Leeia oryzae]
MSTHSPLDNQPPLPPEPPAEGECCDSGCDNCVLDLYAEALRTYQRELALWQSLQAPTETDDTP